MNFAELEARHRSGANWLFWIAALSLLNSIIFLFGGGNLSFVMGLGMTQIIDGIGIGAAKEFGNGAKLVAFALDIGVAGFVVILGILARKRFTWIFGTAMALYLIDGLLFLALGDFWSAGFHGFALWCMWGGFQSCRELNRLSQSGPDDEDYEEGDWICE